MLTRIAPTPSGFLHLGNVLSFAITAALAEQAGARILLRIDDMDRDRVNQAYVQDIFDTLNFLDIPWHEGPRNWHEFESEWSQRHRMELYQQALRQLQNEGQVFACNCSRAQIRRLSADDTYPGTCCNKATSLNTPDLNWRLHTDVAHPLTIHNWPQGVTAAILPEIMTNFVIRKKDGFPAYQLSSVVDDVHFGVNFIVRGEDLWPSTLAQHYLAQALGAGQFLQTRFYHHRLLTGLDGQKLSKSAGATSVRYLRQQGNEASTIYTLIAAMLGIGAPVTNWQELAASVLPLV